ncbi:YciI family protein [Pseudoduganella sp.]|uniref:YciI family protein n=1 Tax=Pseudoduganella sp. TaxID=1880898 RepID=UPI0035AE1759
MKGIGCAALLAALLLGGNAQAQATATPAYDAELAKSLGGNDNGMRRYVFVVLRSGPNKVPAGPERSEMFAGHMANIQRLANERKLAYAGPLDGVDGARGIFIFAVESIDEAKALVATDPVIIKGEMVAEYHTHFGSAGLMMVNQVHGKISKPAAK